MVHILCILAFILLPVGVSAVLGQADLAALSHKAAGRAVASDEGQVEPDGTFTILVNRSCRTDEDALSLWCAFLAGNDVPLLSEDVTCTCVEGDEDASALVWSLKRRLPEGQMKVLKEDPIIAVSKAEVHRFDTLVLSNEMAAALDVSTLMYDDVIEVVRR